LSGLGATSVPKAKVPKLPYTLHRLYAYSFVRPKVKKIYKHIAVGFVPVDVLRKERAACILDISKSIVRIREERRLQSTFT
jgi:hypothetical protein